MPPPVDRPDGVRYALLRTLPGRAIVVGVVVRIAVWLVGLAAGAVPSFLRVVDTVAGLAIIAGAAYFLFRLAVLAKRRLLWRVRRKLILSYIFIGFIPAILIVAFFLLSGLLLFYNFSSYLVQTRLRSLSDQARFFAESTALEIQRGGGRDAAAVIARKQSNAAAEYPGVSIAVVPARRDCPATAATAGVLSPASTIAAGPWAHVDAPREIPGWIGCGGWSGLLAYTHSAVPGASQPDSLVIGGARVAIAGDRQTEMLVRAVAFPDAAHPAYAVVVDLLVSSELKQQLRSETGVQMKGVSAASTDQDVKPLEGRAPAEPAAAPPSARRAGPPSVSFLEFRDWQNGKAGTLVVSTELSIADIYNRISAVPGMNNRNFGEALLFALLVVVGGLFLIIEIVALIAGLALAKSITGSVHELFTGTERVRQGDFTHKIAVKAQDQLGELAESFNSMTASIEDLLRQAAEKKRLEEELRIAHEIQMSLLPQGRLEMAGLSVTALCVPAREVGGDYYDFLPLGDHRLGVLIADVSGKGTSAALYMAELKGLVLSLSRIHTSPRDLLVMANRIIAEHLDARSFITMTYAVIDLDARTMTYARAGHTPLIYVPGPGWDDVPIDGGLVEGGSDGNGPADRHARILAPDGLVLGLKIDNGEMFERLLQEQTIPLHAGDLCLFFTDGITEAMNDRDDCFGETRLGAIVQEHAHLPADELRERVLREIEAFVGDAPQHDDMTMILLKIEEFGAPADQRYAEAGHQVA
ncbi:MAG: PP2C family protein-serine/threonine phosphatase [Betaproteobacteria bacterium]